MIQNKIRKHLYISKKTKIGNVHAESWLQLLSEYCSIQRQTHT